MKIETVRIENFRSFKDETILLDNYVCFVGSNGAGKSTVFNALNVFFRQYKDSKTDLSKLSESDFHHKDTSKEIRITVTFTDLSDQAKSDLSDYVRQDKLIVTSIARYDAATERAEVKQYGNRLGFENFRRFFDAEKRGDKVADLKNIYSQLQSEYNDLRIATTKQDMISALQEYEAHYPEQHALIQSEDQFYGATKGTNRLSPHIQWVFIPAAKDATEESEESKTSALGLLLSRTVRSQVSFDEKVKNIKDSTKQQYQELLEKEQSVLDGISSSLHKRLSDWAHPNLQARVLWKQDPDKSIKIEEPWAYIKIGERGFEGDLSRFGHGLQRSYMLALLQEVASIDDENAPTLVMCIEEPELYQHPPQARYLAETLIELSETGSQILLCTHNPLFIPGDYFDKIRIVREYGNPSQTKITSASYETLLHKLKEVGELYNRETGMVAKLYPSLNPIVNEMFFCRILILVEGQEDVSYITSYLWLMNKMADFRKYGCHIVPVDGKSKLIKPLAMAKLLNIPTYVVYDADTDAKAENVAKHKKDNKAILHIQGHNSENDFPDTNITKENLTCWKTNLTDTIGSEMEKWNDYKEQTATFYGHPGDLNKNALAIAKTLDYAWNDDHKSENLMKLIERIIVFAQNNYILE